MKKKTIFFTAFIFFLILCICLAAYLVYPYLKPKSKEPLKEVPPVSVSQESSEELPENPIDFNTLTERNPDVKAWIKVPGTKVDYAVLQSGEGTAEDYYLNHNIDRAYEFAGCVYIQKINNASFSDPNTVLYGHNMLNGTMFATLHRFRDANFFNENKYIYIYTPGHILTYEIFSAYRYDNRHLLYYFNFNDKQVYADYLNMAKAPNSAIVNTRKETQVTADDKIITLSTCITNDNYRYLVQGVLIDDQPTK